MSGRGVIPDDVYAGYQRAFAGLGAPFAFVDLDALDANARQLSAQAGDLPIRVASKSVRCAAVIDHVLATHPSFQGVLAYTPAEALFLADHGVRNILIAYPSADVAALSDIARRMKTVAGEQDSMIVPIVDAEETLAPVVAAAREHGVVMPVCLDVDAGWRPLGRRGPHLGPMRSPIHTPEQAATLARRIGASGCARLAGIMAYDGQVAGLGDRLQGRPGAAVRSG
jgi:D-serine deaminase-like pyridoxal phosphate-dependent protein